MTNDPHPYNHESIQRQTANKVMQLWPTDGEIFYCLSMMPYPSGQLHMGHVRNYTIGDVLTRYKRLQGYQTFQPMAWDAFGLPAENAAIKHNTHPKEWTVRNIEQMRQQLKDLGFCYDWQNEVATFWPEYYRHQQALFLDMVEKGLVYRKEASVNWDPVDQTVLANEQVIDGKGWRSGAVVEKKRIHQWYLRITDYAEELLEGIDELNEWPEAVLTMQRNWLGQSHGASVRFGISGHDSVEVFTTRVDTLYGVTALLLAPEHPLVSKIALTNAPLQAYLQSCAQGDVSESQVATQEKTGYCLDLHAQHPLSGEYLPVWVANYVLMDYGSGALMCVPAHDERDFEFAMQYNVAIRPVIRSQRLPHTQKGELIHSGPYSGQSSDAAQMAMIQALQDSGNGRSQTQYRLRDWGLSRQRYWGCPIPMVHCQDCGIVPEVKEHLPVLLPTKTDFTAGHNILANCSAFVETTCPRCFKAARRETDTFDTFMDSSWYFHRMVCADADKILDERADQYSPVDLYIGGIEHAILHLLYARFMHKVLRDLGYVSNNEPFKQLLTQGMVLSQGAKMSKSKGNTVSPAELMERYGVDAMRLFICFAAPPEQSLEWSDHGLMGSYKFLAKLYRYTHSEQRSLKTPASLTEAKQHPSKMAILWQIQNDYERLQLNTVVSGCMKLFNSLRDDTGMNPAARRWFFTQLLLRLYPFVPHLAISLWGLLGTDSLDHHQWQTIDEHWCDSQQKEIVVQINGKKRLSVLMNLGRPQEALEADVLALDKIQAALADKTVKRVIYVPKRLFNIIC